MRNQGKYKKIELILNGFQVLVGIFLYHASIVISVLLGMLIMRIFMKCIYVVGVRFGFTISLWCMVGTIWLLIVSLSSFWVFQLCKYVSRFPFFFWSNIDIQMLIHWVVKGEKPTDFIKFSRRINIELENKSED
ncbi:MAG: hypothetical protein H2212_03565 [Ruminococcus sp.]|nr:hypothetical protein [Ruminococcus sp.]